MRPATSDRRRWLTFTAEIKPGHSPEEESLPDDFQIWGFSTSPRKRIAPEGLSTIINEKGRLTLNSGGVMGMPFKDISTAVAAVASVPSSLTSTKALC